MFSDRLKVSRSGLQLFRECPRCFWFDRKGIAKRPQPYPYTLADAADSLAKKEFDDYRQKGTTPSVIGKIPGARLFPNQELLDRWRDRFQGVSWYDKQLNAELFGAIDDCLEFNSGELAIVDYKTSGGRQIRIYPDYQFQMDVYTFIVEQMGHKTKKKAYFIFYQVDRDRDGFNGRLHFREELREIDTNPDTVYPVFKRAIEVLRLEKPPLQSPGCQYCQWRDKQARF